MQNWIIKAIKKADRNRKIGLSKLGKARPEETKKAISTALKGRKLSDETREKMKASALNRKKRPHRIWTAEEREAHGHLVSHGKSLMPEKTKNKIRAKQSASMRRHHDRRMEALRMSHGFGRLRPCRLDCHHAPRHYEVVKFHAPDEPARMTNEQVDFLQSLITSPNLGLDKWGERSPKMDEWLVISRPDPQTIAFHGIKRVNGGNQQTRGRLGVRGSRVKVWNIEDAKPRQGFVNIGGNLVEGESRILKIKTPGGTRYLLVMDVPHREPRPYNPRPGSRPPGRKKRVKPATDQTPQP